MTAFTFDAFLVELQKRSFRFGRVLKTPGDQHPMFYRSFLDTY